MINVEESAVSADVALTAVPFMIVKDGQAKDTCREMSVSDGGRSQLRS